MTTEPTSPPPSDPGPAAESPVGGPSLVWLRKSGARRRQTTLLLGARIRREWLAQRLQVTQVRFQGALSQALMDMQQATKQTSEKNLPIVRLRAALMAKLDGVLRLDRDLGLRDGTKPAFEVRHEVDLSSAGDEIDENLLQTDILRVLRRWNQDVLMQWAERNGVGDVASRVGPAIAAAGLSITRVSLPLVEDAQSGQIGKPVFDLIARQIAERLVGEELFEGLGPCEIVADPTSKSGSVELMTAPTRTPGSDLVFSMAARLSVFSLPYSREVYLRVSTVKRVWASKVPGRKPNAPPRVTCYVLAPNKPILLVHARRAENGWEFDDDHQQLLVESEGALADTLKDAVTQTMPDGSGWWFGLPKLTTLFDRIGGRTVFEGDEVDAHAAVMSMLPDVVDPEVPHRIVKLHSQTSPAKVEMLKMSDLGISFKSMDSGVAGAALVEDLDGDGSDPEEIGESVTPDQRRERRIERYRAANQMALQKVHGSKKPMLWIFGANEREQALIGSSIHVLFGDAVTTSFEVMPTGVHGLRDDLDAPKGKGVERFEARVKRWEATAKQMVGNGQAGYALICAPKEISGRSEDPVNYYAGLHAMCSVAHANVHHLLPIEIDRRTQKPDEQNFVHRLQSALLDVFLAHSGVVLGVEPFVGRLLPKPPQAIYGVQVVRSRAKSFTSETDVRFVLFTRIVLNQGTTEVKFSYRSNNRSLRTPWLGLNEGLRWLGSQRQITSDEKWVRENFAGQVKAVLGDIAKDDPRAVVLIDWGTVRGLWSGINDANLSGSGPHRVMLDNADLVLGCPDMTFVRLRSNREDTMTVRKRSSMLYESWTSQPELVATGDVVEETYVTTTPSIVELNPTILSGDDETSVPSRRHYVGVMRYRKTMQPLRGMSCYRTMRRMKAFEMEGREGKRFEWQTVSPAKEDVALPASMEVTVLSGPQGVSPDDIVRLVFGLRLGFAHYDDWTALPAPLFFAAKVQDYIIRYSGSVGDGPDPDLDPTPDATSDATSEDPSERTSPQVDSYFNDVEKTVLGSEAFAGDGAVDAVPDTETVLRVDAPTQTTVDPDTAEVENNDPPLAPPTDPLLARAWAGWRSAIALYAQKPGSVGLKLYEDMLCGKVRVLVDLPWFVTTKSVVQEDQWPDRRTINRYWRRLSDFDYRPGRGQAPSTGDFRDWLMRRLRIPQALFTLQGFDLFSNHQALFPEISHAYARYLDGLKDLGRPSPEERGIKGYDSEGFADWLLDHGNDAELATFLVVAAHYPLTRISKNMFSNWSAKDVGPMTQVALQYFIDCCEVTREALSSVQAGVKRFPDIIRRSAAPPVQTSLTPQSPPLLPLSLPAHVHEAGKFPQSLNANSLPGDESLDAATAMSRLQEPASSPLHSAAVPHRLSHSKLESATSNGCNPPMPMQAVAQAIKTLNRSGGVTTPPPSLASAPPFPPPVPQLDEKMAIAQSNHQVSNLVALVAGLTPGSDEFMHQMASVLGEIDRLQALHEGRVQAARQAADLQSLLAQDLERRLKLFQRLTAVLSTLTPDVCPVVPAFTPPSPRETAHDDAKLNAMLASIEGLASSVDTAIRAHARIEDLDQARASELQGLSSMDRMRKKSTLLPEAMTAFDDAQKRLHAHLDACMELWGDGPGAVASMVDEPCIEDLSAPAVVHEAVSLVQTPEAANEAGTVPDAVEVASADDSVATLEVSERLPPVAEPSLETPQAQAETDIAAPESDISVELASAGKQETLMEGPIDLQVANPPLVESAAPFQQARVGTVALHTPAASIATKTVVIDSTQEMDQDDADEPSVGSEAMDMDAMLMTLERTVSVGHWALATTCAEVLKQEAPKQSLPATVTIWAQMLATLTGLNARANVDIKLNPAFQAWLSTDLSTPLAVNSWCSQLATGIGAIGASVFTMLLEGQGGDRWRILDQTRALFIEHKPLSDLVERIALLDNSSLMLSREVISSARVGGRQALNSEIDRQRARANSWSNDAALYTNWTATDYVDMHRAMFDDQHGLVLGKCLRFIAKGIDDQARKLLPEIHKYTEKLAGTMSDLRKRTGRRRAFEGAGRDHMDGNVIATVKFIDSFFKLIDRSKQSQQPGIPKNLLNFLDGFYSELKAAIDYVQALDFPRMPDRIHGALALQVLKSVLRMMDDAPLPASLSNEEQLLLLQLPMGQDLRPTMRARLSEGDATTATMVDSIAIFAEVEGVEEDLKDRDQANSTKAIVDLLERSAQRHRDSGRLLPARAIEQLLKAGPSSAMHVATEAAQRKQRDLLMTDLSDARQRVTNAMSLGALAEVDASQMLKVIEAIQRANQAQEIGSLTHITTLLPDYPHARALLRHHILEPLATRLKESRERLERDIEVFRQQALEANPDPQTHLQQVEKINRIRSMLQDGSVSGIRVAHNTFALLRENRLPLFQLQDGTTAHRFERFQADFKATGGHQRPIDRLVDLLRAAPTASDFAWITDLSAEQRAEAAAFVGHWEGLCASRSAAELEGPLTAFFRGMGAADVPVAMPGSTHHSRLAFFLPQKTFVGVDRSTNGSFLPPSLGSAARHLQGFILRHNPSIEAYGQLISESAQSSPTFVLARGNLTLAKRSEISKDHPVILIDDDLVAYMAVHPDNRVGKLMEVGLLTFADNPYDDYGGPVPREMFFGRKAELQRLRGVKSAAVLYGGRRLGKSSLLDQIQIDSRQQMGLTRAHGQGEMAVYVALETRLDTAAFGDNHRLFAWKAIYRGLVNAQFIQGAKADLATPDAIRDWISSEVLAGRAATNACYLLIDEADEVMREDLQAGLFGSGMEDLRDKVRSVCQMRYVIAGLHNLSRMNTVSNSVLGKAETIALQPFSSAADILTGIDLITRPLGALGFHFPRGSENLPLRIMAVCNFYPAFIQLYCKNLVTRLYNKRAASAPPTIVDDSDLDAVESDDEFLKEIQKKFELNLDLDKRYKAIALILADVYYTESGRGLSQGLTATEIRDFCQTLTPEHFKQTGPGAYEALLEEMEKLTVLERNADRYQLRTPHIATMLGTHERVMHLIDELSRETPTDTRIPGESRLVIRSGKEERLFPMPSAWVRSAMRSSGGDLMVLVGNQLSGLHVIERLPKEWELGQDRAIYEAKLFSGPESARTHLIRARRMTENAATDRFIALPSRSWRVAEVEGYAALAASLSRQPAQQDPHQPQKLANIRLALIASPDLAWELAQGLFPANDAAAISAKGWRIEPVPVWSEDAVFYRLDHAQAVSARDSRDAIQSLIESTCGFGAEIDRLITPVLTVEAAQKLREAAERTLAPTLSSFYSQVGMPQAVSPDMLRNVEQLLSLIHGEPRLDEGVEDTVKSSGVPRALFEFFQWMGLLQANTDGRWRVPALYRRLLS